MSSVSSQVPQRYLLPLTRELARELSADRDAGRAFVLSMFADQSARPHVLWHVGDAAITAVSSCAAPDGVVSSPLPMPSLGALLDIEVTLELAGATVASPMLAALYRAGRRKQGQRPARTSDDLSQWVASLLAVAGFSPVAVSVAGQYSVARGGRPMHLVDISAAVSVTDAAAAYRALGHGVGSGRDHGAGLIRTDGHSAALSF